MSTLIASNLTQSGAGDPNIQLQGSQATQFNGLTTHAGGVSVTGGNAQFGNNGLISSGDNTNNILNFGNNCQLSTSITDLQMFRNVYAGTGHSSTQNYSAYMASISKTPDCGLGKIQLFFAATANGTSRAGDIYGFRSNVEPNVGAGNAWAFYTEKPVPSYFNGGIQFDLTNSQGGDTGLLMNAYETGKWTPTLFGQATAGTPTYAASTDGVYTRVGNVVNCWGKIVLTSVGGINGNVRLGGLPITSAVNSNAEVL